MTTATWPSVTATISRTPPSAVDARVEHLPRLAVWRRIVRLEHVEPEIGVRGAADVAEAPLVEQRVERERCAGRAREVLRGRAGAGEVARDDLRDALDREPLREPLRLRDAARRQRDVGHLDDARGVAVRLAAADQEYQRGIAEEPCDAVGEFVGRFQGSMWPAIAMRSTRARGSSLAQRSA